MQGVGEGFIKDCLICPRDDMPVFRSSADGKSIVPQLDGYVIVPRERVSDEMLKELQKPGA